MNTDKPKFTLEPVLQLNVSRQPKPGSGVKYDVQARAHREAAREMTDAFVERLNVEIAVLKPGLKLTKGEEAWMGHSLGEHFQVSIHASSPQGSGGYCGVNHISLQYQIPNGRRQTLSYKFGKPCDFKKLAVKLVDFAVRTDEIRFAEEVQAKRETARMQKTKQELGAARVEGFGAQRNDETGLYSVSVNAVGLTGAQAETLGNWAGTSSINLSFVRSGLTPDAAKLLKEKIASFQKGGDGCSR